MRRLAIILIIAALGAGLAGCGQKGPLRRPEPAGQTLAAGPVGEFTA